MMRKRKGFLQLSLAALVATVIFGCGGSNAITPPAGELPPKPADLTPGGTARMGGPPAGAAAFEAQPKGE